MFTENYCLPAYSFASWYFSCISNFSSQTFINHESNAHLWGDMKHSSREELSQSIDLSSNKDHMKFFLVYITSLH